jgi:uncharacterized membrane protein YeaQ/YmgE (transglycosylase-associated protein family)
VISTFLISFSLSWFFKLPSLSGFYLSESSRQFFSWLLLCNNSNRELLEKEFFMIWTLIVGLIVGAIAKMLMPGRDPGGFIVTMILGVLGAFLAHFIGANAGWYTEGEAAGFIASVVGAVILLAIYRAVVGRRQLTHRH